MNRSDIKIICLTPVRNEAWIIGEFLKATSLWADHIIIADQFSEDETCEIVKRFPKAILVKNDKYEYDEEYRQQLLLAEARKIPGKKLLITLDADEFFTADFLQTRDWENMLSSPVGTVFCFKWINLFPGRKKYWSPDAYFYWGLIDDGTFPHSGRSIHSPRIPLPANASYVKVNDFFVLHFQYVDWKRMESKHRWYQAYEFLRDPTKNMIEVFRQYTHMYNIPEKDIFETNDAWFDFYYKQGIKFDFISNPFYWWDKELLKLMSGPNRFALFKAAVWNNNWRKIRSLAGIKAKIPLRPIKYRIVLWYLERTKHLKENERVKRIDRYLSKYFS